jgi:hypothetical protein
MKRSAPVKACGAKTRHLNPDGSPKRCENAGNGAGGRCRFHGGRSPSGPANGQWKDGRRSKFMPKALADRFLEGMRDKQLMQLRQDVALIEALLTGLTGTLKNQGVPSEQMERRIANLVDHRRRLIEAETRRLDALQQSVTLAQFLATMRVVAEIIREFVEDDTQRRQVQQRLEQLLLAQGHIGDTLEAEVAEPGAA